MEKKELDYKAKYCLDKLAFEPNISWTKEQKEEYSRNVLFPEYFGVSTVDHSFINELDNRIQRSDYKIQWNNYVFNPDSWLEKEKKKSIVQITCVNKEEEEERIPQSRENKNRLLPVHFKTKEQKKEQRKQKLLKRKQEKKERIQHLHKDYKKNEEGYIDVNELD